MVRSRLTATSPPEFKRFSCLGLPMEMRFHYVGQAGLKLLTTSDLPALASQMFYSVTHAGVQWPDLSSLQPPPPGFKRFSRPSFPGSQDHRLYKEHVTSICFWLGPQEAFIHGGRQKGN
ncbi:Histone demethylase UTY, partial [Plecturocebus cupreus]